MEHGTKLDGKLLESHKVIYNCITQEAPVANMLLGKARVFATSVAIAMKVLAHQAVTLEALHLRRRHYMVVTAEIYARENDTMSPSSFPKPHWHSTVHPLSVVPPAF